MQKSMKDLKVVPDWGDYDPEDWREHPEPPGEDLDDDQDEPISADVEMVLGFDPDKEWAEETPSAPEESEEQNAFRRVGDQLALIEAEAVVADTLRRLERIEANEALRAAKEPRTFLARLDTFYVAHVERLREALDRPMRTVVLLRDGPLAGGAATDIEVDNAINEHVAGKRAALLAAAECKPNELPGRVAEVVKEWGHAPS